MRDCVGCVFAGLGGCAGYRDASAKCLKEMTAAKKKAFIDGCDGSCLDHPEKPNYCKPVCDIRPLWKEARAANGGNLVRKLVEGLERAMCRDEGCHPRSDYAVIVDSDTFLRLRMESGRDAMGLPIDAQMKLDGAEIWVMRKMDGFAVARILERGDVE